MTKPANLPANWVVGNQFTAANENSVETAVNWCLDLPRITTITSSATPAVNTDQTDCVTITALAVNITSMTSSLSGTPTNFQRLIYRIKDNGTARTITWGASFVASGVSPLLTTTVANKKHVVSFMYDTVTAAWICLACDSVGY